MIAKHEYIEYLLSTPFNYTCTNMADHKPNLSHDVVSDFLAQQRFTPADLWAIAKDRTKGGLGLEWVGDSGNDPGVHPGRDETNCTRVGSQSRPPGKEWSRPF